MKSVYSRVTEHKRELRKGVHQSGEYLRSLITRHSIAFEEGRLTCLNKSKNGLLVEAPKWFKPGDILEARFPASGNKPVLLEVCWSTSRSRRAGQRYYRVGCRLLFSCWTR